MVAGCAQNAAHIVFRHAVVDGAGGLQASRRFELRQLPGSGNLRQRLAGHLGMRRRPGNGDIDTRSSTWRRSRVLEPAA